MLTYGDKEGFTYDIVASRNVIEHIYDLWRFYDLLYKYNPAAIVFSTTTANYHNPAMRLRHYLIHKKVEKEIYRPQRKTAIQNGWANISQAQLIDLLNKTRGKGQSDFTTAINCYKQNEVIEPVKFLRSNTCDCYSGSWHEHLLTKKEYLQIITGSGYKMQYTSGYWDTHYNSLWMNVLGNILNKMIAVWGEDAYYLSPFVNIVAFS